MNQPSSAAYGAQHAVGADARTAVAQRAHPFGAQVAVDRAVRVGQDDEVVLGAVALEEGVAHASSVAGATSGYRGSTTLADPRPRRLGSATAVSSLPGPTSIAVAAPISAALVNASPAGASVWPSAVSAGP